jgi:hypothetical protein
MSGTRQIEIATELDQFIFRFSTLNLICKASERLSGGGIDVHRDG